MSGAKPALDPDAEANMSVPKQSSHALRHDFQDEIDAASVYRALAEAATDDGQARVYDRLAWQENEHAAFWNNKLKELGASAARPKPSWHARALARAGRVFGARTILPHLIGAERTRSEKFARLSSNDPRAGELAASAKSHARMLSVLGAAGADFETSTVAALEGAHGFTGGNALRAGVLGANDGLVSNLSLVMGVAGAQLAPRSIIVTGIAGLLAGAASMSLGEWLSVQSSRELYQNLLETERKELVESPDAEERELALIYQSRGLSPDHARAVAGHLSTDPKVALDTHAREELGFDPATLGGSAGQAAAVSFLLFAMGAFVPLAPHLMWEGSAAITASVLLSGIVLFVTGAGLTMLTGRKPLRAGLRQLIIGLVAAFVTFGAGRLVGGAIK
jgi:VIT1/CCC1 family predicted Fe2+/Mn2+ transporter/rubrerythrin